MSENLKECPCPDCRCHLKWVGGLFRYFCEKCQCFWNRDRETGTVENGEWKPSDSDG